MADLIERLRAHLDEDERVAREALARAGSGDVTAWIDDAGRLRVGDSDRAIQAAPTAHVIRHSPARTLRWVAAARQILDWHAGEHECQTLISGTYPADWPEGARHGAPGEHWKAAESEHFEGPCPTLLALASIYGEEP